MPRKTIEERREYNRAWRAKNPDKVKANSHRAAVRQRAHRKAHLPRYANYQRNWRANNPKDSLVIGARSRAKKFGLPFDLTVDSIEWPTHCPILGIELDYNRTVAGNRKLRNNYPTLDRRDNAAGYVRGNVFVISHRANRIKSDATAHELTAIAKYTLFSFP